MNYQTDYPLTLSSIHTSCFRAAAELNSSYLVRKGSSMKYELGLRITGVSKNRRRGVYHQSRPIASYNGLMNSWFDPSGGKQKPIFSCNLHSYLAARINQRIWPVKRYIIINAVVLHLVIAKNS